MSVLTYELYTHKEKGKSYTRFRAIRDTGYWVGEIEVENGKFRPRSFELLSAEELADISSMIEELKQERIIAT
jgi:hypothetical protein